MYRKLEATIPLAAVARRVLLLSKIASKQHGTLHFTFWYILDHENEEDVRSYLETFAESPLPQLTRNFK